MVITDIIPVSVTVQSVVSSGVAITDTGYVPPYVWQVQDLAQNEGGIITIIGVLSVSLPGGHIFTNTATITTTAVDADASNNSSSAGVTVSSVPAIAVVKTANVSTAEVGETITYTYRLTNTGNVTLDPVSAGDDRLGAVTLGSASLAMGATTSGTLAYTVVEGDLPGPLANTVTVTGTPPVGSDVTDSDGEWVALTSATPKRIYLPVIWKGFVYAPDLVVDNLVATSGAVTVTIRNAGTVTVVDAFWVDVYFDPSVTPGLNQPWDAIASHGAVWGVTTEVPPGGSLVLTTGGAYYFLEYSSPAPWPVGADVYALVDSINYATTYGAVQESNENNNLFGPVTSTAGAAGGTAPLAAGEGQPSMERLPPR